MKKRTLRGRYGRASAADHARVLALVRAESVKRAPGGWGVWIVDHWLEVKTPRGDRIWTAGEAYAREMAARLRREGPRGSSSVAAEARELPGGM